MGSNRQFILDPKILALAIAGLAIAAAIFALMARQSKEDATRAALGAGRPPGFGAFQRWPEPRALPAAVFVDAAGEGQELSRYRGRAVLVNFWATWCGPCREEMPSLSRLRELRGGDSFTVIAVSADREGEKATRPFLAEMGISNLPILYDPGLSATHKLGVRGLPTSVLVDRQGREVGRVEGPMEWDSPTALQLVDGAAAPPPRASD